jgi:uncharacterized membrane protein YdcZ (DUF606 family)
MRGQQMKLILAGGMFTCGAMFLFEKSNTQPEIGIPMSIVFSAMYVIILIQEAWKDRK